eukprot:5439109-Pleurochrysis_carterae.AAC.1
MVQELERVERELRERERHELVTLRAQIAALTAARAHQPATQVKSVPSLESSDLANARAKLAALLDAPHVGPPSSASLPTDDAAKRAATSSGRLN